MYEDEERKLFENINRPIDKLEGRDIHEYIQAMKGANDDSKFVWDQDYVKNKVEELHKQVGFDNSLGVLHEFINSQRRGSFEDGYRAGYKKAIHDILEKAEILPEITKEVEKKYASLIEWQDRQKGDE